MWCCGDRGGGGGSGPRGGRLAGGGGGGAAGVGAAEAADLYSKHVQYSTVQYGAPTLILEKCVVASGLLFSTSSGSPESVGQLPRLTPGSEGSRSRG